MQAAKMIHVYRK